MIDAGKGFEKDGNKNRLREQDIHKIVDVFNKQIEIGKYSRMVPADRKLKEAKTANIWQNGMKPPCRNWRLKWMHGRKRLMRTSKKSGLCYELKRFKAGKSMEDSISSEFRPIALAIKRLAKQARQQYSLEVDAVVREQSQSRKRIEHLLDGMLDFCFDDGIHCPRCNSYIHLRISRYVG